MNRTFEKLKPYLDKGMALTTALTLLEWDMETLAPEESDEYTSKVIGILSDEYFKNYMNGDVKRLLSRLTEDKEQDKLTAAEQAIIKQLNKLYNELEPIPSDEYREFSELKAKAPGIWAKAKADKKYQEFAPILQEVIDYRRRFAGYRSKGKERIYNIMLEDFEPGFRMEELDSFFDQIKTEIVPLVEKTARNKDRIDKTYNHQEFDIEKQKKFCTWIAGYVGFDYNRGVIAQSAHPFTTNLHNHDVRITDHYYENNLESGIFSMIHESGHAMYEMGIEDELTQTLVGTGTSMGMHESQSRFFENIIGRSKEFWIPVYPKLQETFPEQLSHISLDQFVSGINKSAPGTIRTEADELTYPLHILIRYEIEKMIFEDGVNAEELPKIWKIGRAHV